MVIVVYTRMNVIIVGPPSGWAPESFSLFAPLQAALSGSSSGSTHQLAIL